jgi:hypothetical protein
MRRVGDDGRIERNMNILSNLALVPALIGVLLFSLCHDFQVHVYRVSRPAARRARVRGLTAHDEKNYSPGDRRLLLVSAILFGLGFILIIIFREVG